MSFFFARNGCVLVPKNKASLKGRLNNVKS